MKRKANQRPRGLGSALRLLGAAVASVALVGPISAQAGTFNIDFSTDPASVLSVGGNNPDYWVATGGNPGGFLAITYPVGGQKTAVVFPDIDPGKVVTGFEFSCDLRVGNPQTDRAADGFSISFARDGDPLLLDANSDLFGGNCCAETGTKTGIAVSFDTWAGNTFPNDPKDTADIEGFIIRVDDVTVKKIALPTRNGAADDITSLQTGPRDAAYWTGGGDPMAVEATAGLAWKPFAIKLTTDGKLTVTYKGHVYLDNFQTTYFPTAGRLVFAGRTGGSNESTDVDNIKLVTTAASCASAPTSPANFKASQIGARRVALVWDASTVAGDAGARIAYEIQRDGVTLSANYTGTNYEAVGLDPGKSYAFTVKSKNVCGQASTAATVTAKTVDEVDNIGFLNAQVYRTGSDGTAFSGATQDNLDTVLGDAKYPNSPDNVYYANGLQFGDPTFGDSYGDNHAVRIAGVLTAPKSGKFRFYVRSDDASRFYINTAGAAIPNATTATAVAQENGCCGAFEAPGTADNGDGTFPTSEPISLTAGTKYGVLFLVKEGGGGDWGQVGWREDGDTGPVSVITGPVLSGGKGDPVGAVVNITQQPSDASVAAYKSATFTVVAETASPYPKSAFYQWYKNGGPILGASGASYTVPVVLAADNSAKFKVTIGVVGKSVDSSEATLTVTADVPAEITAVDGSDTFTQATVAFDQPVDSASAATAGNYALDKGVTVSAAVLVGDRTVRLTTSAQIPSTVYKVTVNNVKNLSGKAVAANSSKDFTSWGLVAGRVRADQFLGFSGAGLTDMDTVIADAKYPNSPDVVRYLNNGLTYGEPSFGDTWGDNHMVAMKGVLKPSQSGSYNFFIRSDDSSRLFINTSGAALPDAKTATAIAIEAGCCGGFEEPGAADNGDGTFPTSQAISLTAGQSYGVLYLIKEGGGGDWGQVAWRASTDKTAAAVLKALKDDIYWYGPPAVAAGPTLGVARSATGVTVTFTGTLQSATAVTGPYTDVAGATSPYPSAASGAGVYYRSRN